MCDDNLMFPNLQCFVETPKEISDAPSWPIDQIDQSKLDPMLYNFYLVWSIRLWENNP